MKSCGTACDHGDKKDNKKAGEVHDPEGVTSKKTLSRMDKKLGTFLRELDGMSSDRVH